jgi:hypothetical protein
MYPVEGRRTVIKKMLLILGLLVTIAVIGAVAWIGPRNLIGLLTYGGQAREGDLQVGDLAPQVSLVGLDGSTTKNLAEWIGPRPLVLVFGSFT